MSKRLFDVVVGTLGLIALLPLLLGIALAIKLTSPGPLFYQATRIGRDGKPFHVYKFRSMVVNADKIGPGVTGAADSRVTPVGRFLRDYKLDELPQLLNVVQGTMSFVGPRPEDPRYVALYTEEQRRVLTVRPGITSLASVTYRDEEAILVGDDWEQKYIHEVMPAKLALDLDYIDKQSLRLDISIILKTLGAI
jgi:lipopolysaccharide/colanic/teichoic acid biosynthesis glycosyltransferase